MVKTKNEETKENEAEMSPEKKAYLELVERYKVKNPVKYEQKKAAIEKKIASLL